MGKKNVSAIVSALGVLMSIITALISAVHKKGGADEDFYRLATPEGESLIDEIADLIVRGKNKILRLIFGGKTLILDPTNGLEVPAGANNVFAVIDSDFRKWGADERGAATGETAVQLYEMEKDATFSEMFGSLSTDVRALCLTQAQIKQFAWKYRKWLRRGGYATFFLFESHGKFLVAGARVDSYGVLYVNVYRFEDSCVWRAEHRHRVVVPQLA